MDQLRVYSKILLVVLTLSQVCGNPMFFWSQQEPDCNQQNNNDNTYQNYQQNPYPSYQVPNYQPPSYQGSTLQAPSYQGAAYQGPSYQETLQVMIADTLRALCDIVQSTVQASKQEIATLARVILKKSSHSDCESDETPEEEYDVQPTDSSPGEPQSVTTTGMESNSKPDTLLHNNTTNNTHGDVSNLTSHKANTTLASPSTTKPANSTSEKTNSEVL